MKNIAVHFREQEKCFVEVIYLLPPQSSEFHLQKNQLQ